MKGQNRVFHWKHHTINTTELEKKIHWHLKMQSSVGYNDFDYFLESLSRHIVAGGDDVVSFAIERGFESELMRFAE